MSDLTAMWAALAQYQPYLRMAHGEMKHELRQIKADA